MAYCTYIQGWIVFFFPKGNSLNNRVRKYRTVDSRGYFNCRVIQNMHFLFFYCEKKRKKNWRLEIDTWRPKILVKSPHGGHVKKLISDPDTIYSYYLVQTIYCKYS